MGAWIEIKVGYLSETFVKVAPFVGAWIEIKQRNPWYSKTRCVAPFVGAWIEMNVN